MPPQPPDVPAPDGSAAPPSPPLPPEPTAAKAAHLFEEAAAEASGAARPTPLSLQELARLFPDLEPLGLIGVGGMGVVYRARHRRLDRLVALKVLPPPLAADPQFAERFEREARALARLDHPHIVRVHDVGQVEGHGYLVLEHVDGANLRQVMAAGRLTAQEALAIVPQVCEALQYAHDQGVVHRDIKPENVLLDAKGRVKIADFGLAKLAGRPPGATGLTATGQVMGTFEYMAPEQVRSPQDVDHRADLYSLGVVFYEMLTGALPMGRFEPPSEAAGLDARIDTIVMHALERERSKRYQQAEEMRTDVTGLGRAPLVAAAGAAPARSRDGGRKRPRSPEALLWAAVVTLVLGWVVNGLVHALWGGVIRGTGDAQAREVTKGILGALVFGGGLFCAVRVAILGSHDPAPSRRHKHGITLIVLNLASLVVMMLVSLDESRAHAVRTPPIGETRLLTEWPDTPERREVQATLDAIVDDLRVHGTGSEQVVKHYPPGVNVLADGKDLLSGEWFGFGRHLQRMTQAERAALQVVGVIEYELGRRRVTVKLDERDQRYWWTFEMERHEGSWRLSVGAAEHKVEKQRWPR